MYRDPISYLIVRSKGTLAAVILIVAFIAFELFNFSTTEMALNSLLGAGSVIGLRWGSVLAIAFCSIDLAGLSRLFTPERRLAQEPKEIWYLLGAWLVGAAINAVMTWWAVLNSLIDQPLGNEVITREQMLTFVPIAVSVLVWLTRVLLIGALAVAGENFFHVGAKIERPTYTTGRSRTLGSSSYGGYFRPDEGRESYQGSRGRATASSVRSVPKPSQRRSTYNRRYR